MRGAEEAKGQLETEDKRVYKMACACRVQRARPLVTRHDVEDCERVRARLLAMQ